MTTTEKCFLTLHNWKNDDLWEFISVTDKNNSTSWNRLTIFLFSTRNSRVHILLIFAVFSSINTNEESDQIDYIIIEYFCDDADDNYDHADIIVSSVFVLFSYYLSLCYHKFCL